MSNSYLVEAGERFLRAKNLVSHLGSSESTKEFEERKTAIVEELDACIRSTREGLLVLYGLSHEKVLEAIMRPLVSLRDDVSSEKYPDVTS